MSEISPKDGKEVVALLLESPTYTFSLENYENPQLEKEIGVLFSKKKG